MPCGRTSRHSTSPPSCFTRLRTPPRPRPCDQARGSRPMPLSVIVRSMRSFSSWNEMSSWCACAWAMTLLTSSRITRVKADQCTTVRLMSWSNTNDHFSSMCAAVRRCVRSAFHSAAACESLWFDAASPRVSVFRSCKVWRRYSSISGDWALYISVSRRAPMSSCRSCASRNRSSVRPCSTARSKRTARSSCSTMRSVRRASSEVNRRRPRWAKRIITEVAGGLGSTPSAGTGTSMLEPSPATRVRLV